jgi:hypothetical protein
MCGLDTKIWDLHRKLLENYNLEDERQDGLIILIRFFGRNGNMMKMTQDHVA